MTPERLELRTQFLPRRRTRRDFMGRVVGAAAASSVVTLSGKSAISATHSPRGVDERRLYKAVKWGMIGGADSVLDRFRICQELGYDGMELVSPADFSSAEVRRCSEQTGMPVHGLVDMKHWQVRLSSPDAATRSRGVEILDRAIRDAHAFGGFSVLLVPGRVTGPDENHDHVWQRSIDGIRQVLPLASRLGVQILIENVWNGFCEAPDQLRDYVDEIGSPWVGAYFDIGNALRFAPSEDWIRTLGPRIVKLDVKDWGPEVGFCKIGDGGVDWPEVRIALDEIGFSGWCTAEVAGGDRPRLADIAARMNRVLGIAKNAPESAGD